MCASKQRLRKKLLLLDASSCNINVRAPSKNPVLAESIERECFQVFTGYADIFPKGDFQWSTDSDALREFLENSSLPSGILDAGCGPGIYLEKNLVLLGRVLGPIIGVDFVPEFLERAVREGRVRFASFMNADIRNLPFVSSSFGLVLCTNNTLGNIPDSALASTAELRQRIVKSFVKLLKSNGALFLSVYNLDAFDLSEPYSSDRWLDEENSIPNEGELLLWRKDQEGNLARVYSHWFKASEVEMLLSNAGLSKIQIRAEGKHIRAFGIEKARPELLASDENKKKSPVFTQGKEILL